MSTTSRMPAKRMPPEEREKSIVDGALAVARVHGLEALTVRSVAAAVGVTPALISHYRPVMDDFVAEVFGLIVSAERDEMLARFGSGQGVRADLLQLVESLLDEAHDDVAVVWVQSWSLGARNERLGARVRQEMDRWQTGLEEAIRRAADAGDPDAAVDASSAVWLLLAMVDGMSAHALVKWAPRDRAELARRTVAAVLDGQGVAS